MKKDGDTHKGTSETVGRGACHPLRRSLVVLETMGAGKLALFLMAVLGLLAMAGAILPQHGMSNASAIKIRQTRFPTVTQVADPLGLFDVFASVPFLVIAAALVANVTSCVVAHIWRGGGIAYFVGRQRLPGQVFS